MQINFKNVLAGVGSLGILLLLLLVGIFSKANLIPSVSEEVVEMACLINEQTLDPDFRIPTNEESAIHLDKNGNIYVAIRSSVGYSKYDFNGKLLQGDFGKDVYPPTVIVPSFFVDPDGIAYMLGWDQQTTQVFKNLYSIDLSGKSSSIVDDINSYQVTVDENHIFALSTYKKVGQQNLVYLYKFDKNNVKNKIENVVGEVTDPFTFYSDMALSNAYVFVVDNKNAKLLKFNKSDLSKEAEYSLDFKGDHGLGGIRIYIDDNGNIYASGPAVDTNDPAKVIFKIKKFDLDGNLLGEWNSPFGNQAIYDIAVSRDGFIYLSKLDGVYKYGLLCGEITVSKKAVPQIDKLFSFVGNFVKKEEFLLKDSQNEPEKSKKVFRIWNSFNVSEQMSIEEGFDNEYQNLKIICSDTSATIADRKVSFKLNDGNKGKISCTFENTFVPEGKLKLTKIVKGDYKNYFAFDFKNLKDSTSKTVSLKGGQTVELQINSNAFYSITEEPASEYVPTYDCKKNGATLDHANMEINRGEEVDCVITNTYISDGILKLKKRILPENYMQTFGFGLKHQDGSILKFNLLTINGGYFEQLIKKPGTYQLYEILEEEQKGKFEPRYFCKDQNGTVLDNNKLEISPGVVITCDIANIEIEKYTSKITIIKDAVPNSLQSFYFTKSWEKPGFMLIDFPTKKNKIEFNLKKGSYSITERLNDKYQTTVVCESNNKEVFRGANEAKLNVEFEPITCVFTNKDISIDTGVGGEQTPFPDGGTD